MRRSARMLLWSRLFFPTLFALGGLFLFVTPIHAQSGSTLPSYVQPNVDANVKIDQHTLIQSVTIETISAFICQVSGIDVLNPRQGCLGINTQTNKLGYATPRDGSVKVGGLIGMGTGMIDALYTQPASGIAYVKNVASNFGIAKHSYAQGACGTDKPIPGCDPNNGFDALQPIQKLWVTVRNLTFILFVLVFVLLGVGIMLRVKIDAKTVMTVQSQLPKVVVSLILISFSYAIVGFLIDFMWISTYAGINILTTADNPDTANCAGSQAATSVTLKEKAYSNILNMPIGFVNDIFAKTHCSAVLDRVPGEDISNSGLANLSWSVGSSIGDIVDQSFRVLLDPDKKGECSIKSALTGGVEDALFKGMPFYQTHDDNFSVRACAVGATLGILDYIASVLGFLIILIAILIAMFRLWFTLLKAYVYVIIYTILAPFWVVLGLVPGSTMNFSRWLRTVFAHLALFPAAVFLIITARIILDTYREGSNNYFITPLVNNPTIGVLGPLLAFGILMITPELLNFIREALKAPAGKVGGLVASGLGAGAAPVRSLTGGYWGRLTRFDPHKGEVGLLSGVVRNRFQGNKILSRLGGVRGIRDSDKLPT